VAPADDERDNIVNVTPHGRFVGSALYEYLPPLSQGTAAPQPVARVELTTVDLVAGAETPFEAALGAEQATLQGETLWYRMLAGGPAPRYLRMRPRANLTALLDGKREGVLPEATNALIAKMTVEILNLRPAMCYGLTPAQ
jgi:hypothetical protein